MSPAEMLRRAIAGSQGRTQQPITDELALAIARRLESQGIAKVPGLPEVEESSEDRLKRVLEYLRSDPDESPQPEPEAAPPPQSTAGIVREAIADSIKSSGHIPLNGAAVLRAALAGGPGTINGVRE